VVIPGSVERIRLRDQMASKAKEMLINQKNKEYDVNSAIKPLEIRGRHHFSRPLSLRPDPEISCSGASAH
jgi:hypothetical protein